MCISADLQKYTAQVKKDFIVIKIKINQCKGNTNFFCRIMPNLKNNSLTIDRNSVPKLLWYLVGFDNFGILNFDAYLKNGTNYQQPSK
jgi:hypothetical protein